MPSHLHLIFRAKENNPEIILGEVQRIHIQAKVKTIESNLQESRKMPEAILKTWTEIWQDTQLNRAYRADVTVHGQKYFDGDHAVVETYISIID